MGTITRLVRDLVKQSPLYNPLGQFGSDIVWRLVARDGIEIQWLRALAVDMFYDLVYLAGRTERGKKLSKHDDSAIAPR